MSSHCHGEKIICVICKKDDGKVIVFVNKHYTVKHGLITMTIDENMACDNHEEADTKIVHHVCKLDTNAKTNVLLKTSDTDVLITMLGNIDHLQSDDLEIFMEFGTGNSKRCINITKLHTKLGLSLCKSLPGFHAITGCDYNPYFFQKGKVRPFKILMKNNDYQKALADIGVAHITGLRDNVFQTLETFVCEIYGYKNSSDINAARFKKFCATYKADKENEPFKKKLKNCDPSTLPPCKAELQQHLLRTQYITSIWRNAYLRFPTSLTPNRNGWILNEGALDFNWFDGDCMPQLVFDAVIHENTQKATDRNIEDVSSDNAEESQEAPTTPSSDEESSDERIYSDED